MRFKYWLHLQEAIDQNTEKALLQQKVDAKELNDFINQLKIQPEFIDTRSAFVKLQEKFPIQKKEKFSIEAPIDPFFKEYYDQLSSKQITKPEYDSLLFFSKENRGLLSEMMQSLRNLIQQRKIDLIFNNNIPTIVYRNESISNKDFTKFNATLHGIEGQNTTNTSNKNLADPFFLEVSHKEKLVAKNPDGTIWVFKATGPLDCRLMGKGQSWCISSSSSAQWYFNYRHDHGQTQYFIFDFNKGENDPARYVNPGVAPEGEYSEWVDTRNSHDDINGYSSVQDYKDYLEDNGIDVGVFVADPLTKEEELLKKSSENYKWSSSSEKDKIFQEFKEGQYKELFDKFIESMSFLDVGLLEDHFNQLSDQQKKLYLSNVGGEGLGYLLETSSEPIEMLNQILPFVKDKLDSDMVNILINVSLNPDELTNQILPFVKDKLDSDMVNILINVSSKPDKLINRILPFVEDKLDLKMVSSLLGNSKNRDAMIDQILPFVKDKLDSDMVEVLILTSSHRDELIKNQILPLVKDKLDSQMFSSLLRYSKNRDAMIDQILPFFKDKLEGMMIQYLLNLSKNKTELINQILTLIKDKLDGDMIGNLLSYSENKDQLTNQILPFVKDKLDSDMVGNLLYYSKNKDAMIDQILPFVKDKLDSDMVFHLLRFSSNKDELKKRIDDMKFREKE